MDARFLFADPLLSTALHHLLDQNEETDKSNNAPTQKYVRDARAMASTPADVKELPNKYTFAIDMPGVKPGDVSVRVEDDNVLVINGERKREAAEEGMKYLRMERKMGEFMRKFVLPENADVENGITAECKEGVLTVNVMKKPPPEPKKPPPEPKKPKTIQVQVA